jgi:hypothetical protein
METPHSNIKSASVLLDPKAQKIDTAQLFGQIGGSIQPRSGIYVRNLRDQFCLVVYG